MNIDRDTSLEVLINNAKNTIDDLNTHEVFIVKDLFRGFEWNRILKGNRTKLGSLFYNFAVNEGGNQLKPLGKTPQNQQKYEKI